MATQPVTTRRSFLRGLPLAGMAASLPYLATNQDAAVAAVPVETLAKIKAWQNAHRAATDAWNNNDRRWQALSNETGRARQAMIFALWEV